MNVSHTVSRKRLSLSLDIKTLERDGHFAGYASVFDVPDSQRDVIVRGAFEKSLSQHRDRIRLLWQHNHQEPIGVFTHLFEDQRGLYVEGRLMTSITRAKEAYLLLKSGSINGLSIGYIPTRHHYDVHKNLRFITELDLWEISLVTFPANDAARVTVVKSQTRLPDQEAVLHQNEYDVWKHARAKGELITLCDAIENLRCKLRNV